MEKDAPRATPVGTTFTVPAAWMMTTKDADAAVVADKAGKRQLITRDAQHEYVFVEEAAVAKP